MNTGGGRAQLSPPLIKYMDISKVADIIHNIAEGFEENCIKCLSDHSGKVVDTIKEQLWSGLDANEQSLSPTYDDDPFFEEKGEWYHRSGDYKAWKRSINRQAMTFLELPSRPDNVPNLFIDGTFYSEISATLRGGELLISPGTGNGPEIVAKYKNKNGDILNMGPTAIEYFNREYMMPSIDKFFKDCGFQ